jgi:hypothetical protein
LGQELAKFSFTRCEQRGCLRSINWSLSVNASETLMPDTINAGTRLIEEGTLFTKIWAIRKRALDLFFLHGW